MPGACVLHAFVPVFSRERSKSRYKSLEFPTTSEFPTKSPTHTRAKGEFQEPEIFKPVGVIQEFVLKYYPGICSGSKEAFEAKLFSNEGAVEAGRADGQVRGNLQTRHLQSESPNP